MKRTTTIDNAQLRHKGTSLHFQFVRDRAYENIIHGVAISQDDPYAVTGIQTIQIPNEQLPTFISFLRRGLQDIRYRKKRKMSSVVCASCNEVFTDLRSFGEHRASCEEAQKKA